MKNLFRSFRISRILLSGVMSATTPMLAYATYEMGTNKDAEFAVRMEKQFETIKTLGQNLDAKKLIEKALELKHEVEAYSGEKLDLDNFLEQVSAGIKSRGGNLKKNHLKAIHHLLKKEEKRGKHKALYIQKCMENGLPYIAEEEELIFLAKHGHDKKKGENEAPLRVTVGVLMTLNGLFLATIPLAPCQTWGINLIESGIALAIQGSDDKK